MTSPASGTAEFHDDFSGPAGFWYVDRSAECQRLIDRIKKSAGKPVFVHGRRGVGKSSLLTSHLSRFLEQTGDSRELTFGRLTVDATVAIRLDVHGKAFEDALREPRIICIENLLALLQARPQKQHAFLDWLHDHAERKNCKAAVVFSLDDEDIGGLMAIGALSPNFRPEMFQMRRVDLVSSIRRIVESIEGSSDWLEDSLLKRISSDAIDLLPNQELAISPVLAAISASELIKMRSNTTDGRVQIEHYVEGERLIGLLENHVKSELNRLSEAGVATYDDLVRIIDEVLAQDSSRGLGEIDVLAARLDMEDDECIAVINRIASDTGMLRPLSSGQFVLDPNQLYTALRALTRKRRNQLSRLENEITEYTESGLTHGTGLPRDVLKQVILWQYDLRLDQRDTQFVVDWILRTRSCTIEDAAYWLRRIEDPDLRLDIVSSAAFDQDRDARLKATELLRLYEIPEATEILFKLALHDANDEVRERAGVFLAQDSSSELSDRIRDVVRAERSTFRANAVETLRNFTDDATIDLLLEVAQDRNDRETAIAAISVLAECPEPRAVSGITKLGLTEQDPNRQKGINDSLGGVTDPTHIGRILDAVSSWRILGSADPDSDGDTTSIAKIVLRVTGGLAAIVLNLAAPGAIMLLTRRWKAGILFVLLSASNLALMFTTASSSVIDFAMIAHLVLLLVSLVWSATALLNAKDQFQWPQWSLKTIIRAEVFVAIGVLIVGWGFAFLTGNALIPPPHGFFHLITGRVGRAALIFLLELLAIALWFVGRYQAQIMYPPSELFLDIPLADINAVMSALFLNAWILLFVGTLIWDVLGISIQRIMFPRLINRFYRREELLRKLLSRDSYADYLVGVVLAGEPQARTWATRLIINHGNALPPDLLLKYAETDNRSLQRVLEKSLSRMEASDSISALANKLEVDVASTQRLATKALTTRPTAQSLRPLKERSDTMTPYQRRRLLRGKLVYHVGRLGSPGGAVAVVMFLVLSFVAWVGSETLLDPYHPLEEHVLLNCDPVSWPPNQSADPYERSEWAKQRAAAASSLAKMVHSAEFGDSKRREGTIDSLRHVYNFECDRETPDPDSRLLVRISALSGLTHLANQDALYYRADTSSVFARLKAAPLDVVREGLDSQSNEVREQTILTLQELRAIGSIDEEFANANAEGFPRLFGEALRDRQLSTKSRQIALDQLRITGGSESVQALLEYVLDWNSLYRGRDSSSRLKPRAGLGLSRRQSVDESLAQGAIKAIGEICAPESLEALDEITDNITNVSLLSVTGKTRTGECDSIQSAAQAADGTSESEIRTLQKLFDAGDYQIVISTADLLPTDNDAPGLRALAGRAHFALGTAESNPSRKMEYWRSANRLLSEYIATFDASLENIDINPDAVIELARSRLWIGRSHMDLAWSESEDRDAILKQFDTAVGYFESIYDESVVHEEHGRPLSLLITQLVDEGEIARADYNGVLALALSFRAAAMIDGQAADSPSDEYYRRARQLLTRAIEADVTSWWSRYLMALSYWGTGDFEQALEFSRLALLGNADFRGNSSYELPYRLMYQMRDDLDDPVGAYEALRDDIGETSPWPHYYLAMLYQDYAAPRASGGGCTSAFVKAHDSALTYASLIDNSEDPWVNLLVLEAAISAGRTDKPSSRSAANFVATRLGSFGSTEAVAVLLLIMADLTSDDDSERKSDTDPRPAFDDLLSRLPAAYEALPQAGSTNWNGTGLRYYVDNCSELDATTAMSLSDIINIIENQRTGALVKDLRRLAATLRGASTLASESGSPNAP